MRTCCPAITLAACTAAASGQTVSVLAWFGRSYPSIPGNGVLLATSSPDVNIAADGTVVFQALTTVQPVLCQTSPAGPVVLAQVGTPAPDSGGYMFGGIAATQALSGGRAVFRAGLSGTGLPNSGALYLADASGQHLCLLYGQTVPGHAGVIINGVSGFACNGSLITAIAGTGPNRTTTTGSSLWQGVPGAMSLLVHTGDPAPGMPAGRTFVSFYSAPAATTAGFTVFDATALPAPDADGLWTGPLGSLTILRQTGDAIPTIPGATFRYLWNPIVNAPGDMLFSGTINDGSLHEALWLSSGGGLSILARQGDPAPGTTAFYETLGPTNFPPNTVLTDAGLAIFNSTLTGPGVNASNNNGLWAGGPGQVRLVARTGDTAPGFPAGSTYTSFTFGNSQPEFAADGQGNVAFCAVINGGSVAMMVSDLRGHTYPLLAPNLPITLDSTPNETIVSYSILSASGNPGSGRASFMNASGQLGAQLRTTSAAGLRESIVRFTLPPACYPNCDLSLFPPILNVNDFVCYLNRFAAGDSYANCDGSTAAPILNVLDFTCFLNAFAAGCP